jgi:hypothetical protein
LGLLIGIILVWLAKINIKKKILLTLVPLPIILAGFLFFYFLLPKAEPEMFLIPQNLRGEIVVIFDENCGQHLDYENGRRIYRFPDSGVLITKSKKTMGVIDRKFYLVDENGNRIKLPEFHWNNFEEEQKDWHWLFSSTKLSKDSLGVFWAYRNELGFVISNYKSVETTTKENREENVKQFHDTKDFLLTQCRQMKIAR